MQLSPELFVTVNLYLPYNLPTIALAGAMHFKDCFAKLQATQGLAPLKAYTNAMHSKQLPNWQSSKLTHNSHQKI